MPVEGIRYGQFEDNRLVFVERRSFLDGEVLVEIALATDVAQDQRSISVNVSTLRYQVRGIRIKEGSAIEVVVGTEWRECAIRVLVAPAKARRGESSCKG